MIVQKTVENGTEVLTISGRLDTQTAPDLEQELDKIGEGCKTLILDLSGLEYISSAGLRVILKAQKYMAAKGGMKITGVNETVMEIFDITGFLDILTIE
ncbi:MAG: STAS domain-containing protein [Lachnospiraceae bacterium]|nr:STAS domain-containing protein [Lachnospiraceae bacterium]